MKSTSLQVYYIILLKRSATRAGRLFCREGGAWEQKISKMKVEILIPFWISAFGIALAVAAGGLIWRSTFLMHVIVFCLLLVGSLIYLIWRGIMQHGNLPHFTGDWICYFSAAAVIGFWLISPGLRDGMERAYLLLFFCLVLVLMIDFIGQISHRETVLHGVVLSTGIVAALALLEVYGQYFLFWESAGSREIFPPYTYRLVSLLGHSNAYMAMLNLTAPLAVTGFLVSRQRPKQFLFGFWIVVFLITVPFTTSHGGLIGLIVWLIILSGLWLKDKLKWNVIQTWVWQRWLQVGGLSLLLLCSFGLVILKIWGYFASHPSHGSGFFSSRSEIWLSALRIWTNSPWVGIGIGRFGIAYLDSGMSIPPNDWPTHAHNILINTLSETGILGAIVLLLFLFALGRLCITGFKTVSTANLPWARAALAGLSAWAVQSLVDDFLGSSPVMLMVILLTAWLVTGADQPLPRRDISLAILVIPILILGSGTAYFLASYRPLVEGLEISKKGNWTAAAERLTSSARRDSRLAYYSTQAGLAWAQAWGQDHHAFSRLEAEIFLENSLDLVPTPAILWADLGVIRAQGKDYDQALLNMLHAEAIAPSEPSFPLNLGSMYEAQGQTDAAKAAYARVLELAPDYASHPFWQQSDLHRAVFKDWQSKSKPSEPVETYWSQARTAISAGRLEDAQRLLAVADWTAESDIAVLVTRGQLAAARGNTGEEIEVYQEIASQITLAHLNSPVDFARTYSQKLYQRDGMDYDLVPGYLQLASDVGQFNALQRLWELQTAQGNCSMAGETWVVLQRARSGGSLEADRLYPVPACQRLNPQKETP